MGRRDFVGCNRALRLTVDRSGLIPDACRAIDAGWASCGLAGERKKTAPSVGLARADVGSWDVVAGARCWMGAGAEVAGEGYPAEDDGDDAGAARDQLAQRP